MKKLLTLTLSILLLVCSQLHAQENNPNINFKINGHPFAMDSQELQDGWSTIVPQLQAAGIKDPDKLQHLQNTYQTFVNQAKTGTYNINTSGGKAINLQYTGAPGANLGLNPNGSTAEKSGLGNVLSAHKYSDIQAMAILNPLIGNYIAQVYYKEFH